MSSCKKTICWNVGLQWPSTVYCLAKIMLGCGTLGWREWCQREHVQYYTWGLDVYDCTYININIIYIYTYYVFIRCCKRLHQEFLATFLWKSIGVGCPPFRKLRPWQESIICAGHVDVPMTPATPQVSETTTQIQLEERKRRQLWRTPMQQTLISSKKSKQYNMYIYIQM
jgi:hypothetical protein